jgi:DNA polymerase-3 subunit epsilon
MDFVAIDFETANSDPSSACQVGLVRVLSGAVAGEYQWLIRPPRNYFSRFNIAVHGIRSADVAHCPSFGRVWEEIQPHVAGLPLLAHNARFDLGVLSASLRANAVDCPELEFNCTRLLAKAAWPGRQRYGLKHLASWQGIQFQHHDALEDARACAQLALRIAGMWEDLDSLSHLEAKLQVSRGRLKQDRIYSPKRRGSSAADGGSTPGADRWGFPIQTIDRPAGSVCSQTILQSSQGQPLEGKLICLLGPLRGLSWLETIKLLNQLGGQVQASVDRQTHYLIATGGRMADAQQILAQAADGESRARILSERQFRALLPGGAFSS